MPNNSQSFPYSNKFLQEFDYKRIRKVFRRRFLLENLNKADHPHDNFRNCVLKCVELGTQYADQNGVEKDRIIVSASVGKKAKFVISHTARIHLNKELPEALVERFLEVNKCIKPSDIYYNPIIIVLKTVKRVTSNEKKDK